MECPKCGYDRQPEDTHCALCGVDFGLLERQAAEKKQLKAMKSTQPGRKGTGSRLEMEVIKPGKIDDTVIVSMDCPKCGALRHAGDFECHQCGVIYEKHEQMLAQKKAEEEAQKRAEKQRFLEEKARIQREAEEGIRKEREKREAAAKKQILADMKVEEKQNLKEGANLESKEKFFLLNHIDSIMGLIKSNIRKISIALIIFLAVIATGWGSYHFISDWKEKNQNERLLAEQKAEHNRMLEEQQLFIQEFYSKKEERIQYLMSLITERKFDQYTHEMKKYDSPQLKAELEGVKNYFGEIQLFDSTKLIPASEFEKNYEAFYKLVQLNPINKEYAERLDYYRIKLAQQNCERAEEYLTKKKKVRSELNDAIAAIDRAIQLDGTKKNFDKVRFELKSAELLFFEGNNNMQMAVRNDGLTKGATGGQRKIYVWLKNVGDTPYFINVDYFTLIGKDKKQYSYNNCSRELIVNLQPGQETGGFLYFYTASQPDELVFNHINAGKISRKFP